MTGLPLPEQAARPGEGNSLGAVGRAELAEDVADVLLGRFQRHYQFPGDLLIRRARCQQREHLQFPAGQRIGQPRPDDIGGRCHLWRYRPGVMRPECLLEAAQVGHRDASGQRHAAGHILGEARLTGTYQR